MLTQDFDRLFRSSIGFDRLACLMDASLNKDLMIPDTPRYDIATLDESHYRITMAVPGFKEKDLNVEVADQTLTVSGKMTGEGAEPTYLYKGLTSRDFKHTFKLADHVKVAEARLDNGLLTIDLERIVPEELRPQTIKIEQGAPTDFVSKAKKLLDRSKNGKAA